MKIGELAQRSGLSASTIRFYEKQGLLPKATRAANGYRIYSKATVNRLQLIKFAQSLGFALDELPALVNKRSGWDHDLIIHRLKQKKSEADALLTQFAVKKQRINHLIQQLSQTWNSGQCMQQDKLAEILNTAEFSQL
jgi:DNA-binding transcriptional MerR regulator